jgi:hypothetical protein
MSGFLDHLSSAWDRIREGQQPLGRLERIADECCLPAGVAGQLIKREEMYFSVRVNQMELAMNRWFDATFDPLVVVVTEFIYDGVRVAIPSVIGPSLIQTHIASGAPRYGTVLTDTRVTGPHPYRGGDVDISISFYRIKRSSMADAILGIVENLSRVAGAGQLVAIAQTGKPLLDGVKALAGVRDTEYLAGQRTSVAMSGVLPLKTQFLALLMPSGDPAPATPALSVQDRRLFVRSDNTGPSAYRDSDFVLCSIEGSRQREDESLFPFYSLKRKAIAAVSKGDDGLKLAKADLIIAYQQMQESADLTRSEVKELFDAWVEEFKDAKREAQNLVTMGPGSSRKEGNALPPDLSQAINMVTLQD